MDKQIFDRDSALDRVGGDLDLLVELAGMFIEDVPNMMEQIEQAASERNADVLHRCAHTLKGAVGNFSAQASFDAAHDLEARGRTDNLDGVGDAVESLKRELSLLEPVLSAL